jgi:aspartate--ammonia ligase
LSDKKAVVVNSLAKWKRVRLKELEVKESKGIVTDMRALRPDEDYSAIHSIYVDQWDWEKRISEKSRTLNFLKKEVNKIYSALVKTERKVIDRYQIDSELLPEKIHFIHTEQLLQDFPHLSPKEREKEIVRKHKAVFLIGIGHELSNGEPHDGRAPDYDDWSTKNEDGFLGLNGDILLWHPILKDSFEISSMGIRVDKHSLLYQLNKKELMHKKELFFHKSLLKETLPFSIGGGIGQSRICMFLLRKQHIGEVQVGIWDESIKKEQLEKGVRLL